MRGHFQTQGSQSNICRRCDVACVELSDVAVAPGFCVIRRRSGGLGLGGKSVDAGEVARPGGASDGRATVAIAEPFLGEASVRRLPANHTSAKVRTRRRVVPKLGVGTYTPAKRTWRPTSICDVGPKPATSPHVLGLPDRVATDLVANGPTANRLTSVPTSVQIALNSRLARLYLPEQPTDEGRVNSSGA
jgi:hypothetical protein